MYVTNSVWNGSFFREIIFHRAWHLLQEGVRKAVARKSQDVIDVYQIWIVRAQFH